MIAIDLCGFSMRQLCCILTLSWLFLVGTAGAAPPPANLPWKTLEPIPSLGSPEAKSGGRVTTFITSFPLTLRTVGPDSNDAFRTYISENNLSLVSIHPTTGEWMPELATHWALAKNNQTVYYRLDPAARWSDGKPVKASDFLYTLEFMRSPHIKAPWYNDYYQKTIESIEVFEEPDTREVIAVTLRQASPDALLNTNLSPTPRHFYGTLDENFVSSFNWKVAPNTGPYQIDKIDKGRRITFRKKADWWAKNKPYYQNRFNVDEVIFKVVREIQVAFEYLKAGEIDVMELSNPELWHSAGGDDAFGKGYIHRLQAYNDTPRMDYVLIMNAAVDPFQDHKVRLALQHAMNVDKVNKELLKGDYQRLQGISQGYGPYTNPKITAHAFDIKKADALLEEAGWTSRDSQGIRMKNGKRLAATIIYNQSTLSPRLIILREEARKAGFDLGLQLMDPAATYKTFQDKRHQLALIAWSTAYRPEYRSRLHSSNAGKPMTSNYSNTASPALDQLIEEYEHASDEGIRIGKAHAIQQFVHDDATHIPLFEVPYYRLAHWAWLRFPTPPGPKTADGLSYFDAGSGGLFWIDPQLQKAVFDARKRGARLDPVTRIDETFRLKR